MKAKPFLASLAALHPTPNTTAKHDNKRWVGSPSSALWLSPAEPSRAVPLSHGTSARPQRQWGLSAHKPRASPGMAGHLAAVGVYLSTWPCLWDRWTSVPVVLANIHWSGQVTLANPSQCGRDLRGCPCLRSALWEASQGHCSGILLSPLTTIEVLHHKSGSRNPSFHSSLLEGNYHPPLVQPRCSVSREVPSMDHQGPWGVCHQAVARLASAGSSVASHTWQFPSQCAFPV